MADREFRIHYARVMLGECRARRHHPANRDFYWSLFSSAQRARRQLSEIREPVQGGLFG